MNLSDLPLAHQGGWDEILMVVGPLAIVGFLLLVATRRLRAKAADRLVSNDNS